MASAHVQHPAPVSGIGVSLLALSFAGDTTTGSLLVAQASTTSVTATRTIDSVTDSEGNTYSPITASISYGNFNSIRGFYTANATGGASHQVTANFSASCNATLGISEWSGVNTSPTLTANSGSGTGTAVSSGAVSPTGDNLYIGSMNYAGTTTAMAPDSPWNELFEITITLARQNSAYQVATSGSQTGNWTIGASKTWGAWLAAFDDTVAAVSMVPVSPLQQFQHMLVR